MWMGTGIPHTVVPVDSLRSVQVARAARNSSAVLVRIDRRWCVQVTSDQFLEIMNAKWLEKDPKELLLTAFRL